MDKIKIVVIIGVIIGSLFIVRFFNFQNSFLGDATSYVTRPIGYIFSGIGWWTKDKFLFFKSIGDLKIYNQKLFDENLELKGKIAKLSEIEKENNVLRRELKLAPRDKYELEMAIIIGRESGQDAEIVYIDKGTKNGIEKGMAVLIGKGALVGRVMQTTLNISKIQLITDKNFKVNAKLIESDGRGVVFGQYGTSAKMKMLPQTIKINKGDTIVTSKLSDNFKDGLLIGYAQEVSVTSDRLFQEVSILLPQELDNLYLVQILKK